MTSAQRGGGGGVSQYVTNNSDRLRECVTKGRGGGPKSGKFCGRHLSIVPKGSSISYLRPFAKFSGFETRRRNVINITRNCTRRFMDYKQFGL